MITTIKQFKLILENKDSDPILSDIYSCISVFDENNYRYRYKFIDVNKIENKYYVAYITQDDPSGEYGGNVELANDLYNEAQYNNVEIYLYYEIRNKAKNISYLHLFKNVKDFENINENKSNKR